MKDLILELKKCGLIGVQNYDELASDLTDITAKEKQICGSEFGVSEIQRIHKLGYNRASRAIEAGLKIGLFQNEDTSAVYKYAFTGKAI